MCVVQIRTFPFRQDFREMRSIFSSFPEGFTRTRRSDLENHRRLPSATVDGILDKLNIRLESHGGRHLGHVRQFNAVFIPVHVRAVLFSPLLPEETEAQVSVIGCALSPEGGKKHQPCGGRAAYAGQRGCVIACPAAAEEPPQVAAAAQLLLEVYGHAAPGFHRCWW